MLQNFPSLLGFQPRFYTGGPTRFHLSFLYDLVALTKPKVVITLGFSDGQAHFAFCQAAREQSPRSRCFASHRDGAESEDTAWGKGQAHFEKYYRDLAELRSESPLALAQTFPDRSVGLLLIDDCDSGTEIEQELSAWEAKLLPGALVLLHGSQVERDDSVRAAWREWTRTRPAAESKEGIGLAIARQASLERAQDNALPELLDADALTLYRLASQRLEAEACMAETERASAALQIRSVWLHSVVKLGADAQRVIDHQANIIRELEPRFEALRRDRAKAQLIMDAQREQLQNFAAAIEGVRAERDQLKSKVKEQKQVLAMAKAACRRRGNCFRILDPGQEKERRPLGEKVLREIQRLPRNLLRSWGSSLKPLPVPRTARPEETVSDRYVLWIAEREPDAVALQEQRRHAASWETPPKITLLVPVHDTPGQFLNGMLESVENQTYGEWELCVIDAGSKNPETIATLARWEKQDGRIRICRLEQNLGIADNTNRALELAKGDFITCVDHDDLLAPSALYRFACAIREQPEAEIFYSDEDRLSADGKRHSPFFKPEWSPALLCSSMYLGHLTAYRRELVQQLGGWRKEFDLSQDYDLALRATDRARIVGHISHVLYHWREHPQSGSAGGKPEARKTNLAALADAMERRGLAAEIIEYPSANRARLKISQWPKVSIIVPTDSVERARLCLEQLPQTTAYPDYEIVFVTNSALAERLEMTAPKQPGFSFVRYDKPFNFSEKCNLGAQAASGTRLIFFNDDVESGQPDWIQNVIEPLENPEVGAVAPKLLYATGKIQHAGLVTGVRGLVGTAFHQWPADSVDYSNLAQSTRDVSALSAACLAMRTKDFFAVGEFDAVNTPIAHSDLDLCFKIRDAGLRCVYTPFVTMTHRGHASIGAIEEEGKIPREEKASVYLLKRWPSYACHDPYFPNNMRDWLYTDSPTPTRMWSGEGPNAQGNQPDLLFISHDLSWSGAPLILLHAARSCRERGFFVVAMSPEDGPLRMKFAEAGIPLLVDPLITQGHPSFTQFAREFDCIIASTIFAAPIVHAAKAADIPHLWWIHEGRVAEHYMRENPTLRAALGVADLIATPDIASSQIYQPFAHCPIRVLSYGIPDPMPDFGPKPRKPGPVKFLLLGTIEHRKGQQVLLEALGALPDDVLLNARFQIVGRPHDLAITGEIETAARGSSYLTYKGAVPHAEALALIRDTDVMICASWDETGPLILIEALALGKAILSTTVGTVAENLAGEEGGLFVRPGDARALAAAIERLVREPQLRERLGRNGRAGYEKHFTFERFGENFETLIREVISSAKPRYRPGQSEPSTTTPFAPASV